MEKQIGYSFNDNNAERVFYQDIREKKRASTGAFHKKGHGVKHGIGGALKTPSYFMKEKERKKLNGECVSFNMYETILPRKEFEAIQDFEKQKAMFARWREIYPSKKIMEEMGVNSPSYISKYLNKFDLPKKQRGGTRSGSGAKEKQKSVAVTQPQQLTLSYINEEIPQKQTEQLVKLITNGLHLEYNGTYDAEQIGKIFTKLQLLTDGETNKFKLNISISEVEDK